MSADLRAAVYGLAAWACEGDAGGVGDPAAEEKKRIYLGLALRSQPEIMGPLGRQVLF